MPSHNFSLVVKGRDVQEVEVIDALFESGCDGGTAGRSVGVQFVVFDREACSLQEAVLSAMEETERVHGMKVVGVEPVTAPVMRLKGMVPKPERPVSLEEIEEARWVWSEEPVD